LQPLSGGKELLTDTEHTVYQLLIAGRRNDEIASVLGVTLRTVKFHTANIYRKLNVRCRAQAIARAGELGDL
jgi:LuxR family maltose regulon positive regulatory protein